ncbi:MAG TPA: DinB family protein [Caldilineaceae bacterium]|nr:DinB family protein [Caldilineaceae bacterium]
MPNALTIAQVAQLLGATVPMLQAELAALPVAITQFQPAPNEWSINEVIGHLIETEERGFAGRITRMLAQEGYVCQAWDADQVARERRDNEKMATLLLAELAERRAASLDMVRTLMPNQLTRTAMHPVVGILTVNDLLHEWVFHDHNHIKQILTNLQKWVWPAMGNTQRFTTG